jgi:DNA repair and recombination RAD54-like protein
MGRIYRQGQKKPCIIYRLFTSGTIEEVILQRQIIKRGLSHLAADLHGGYVEKFSKEELAGCFDLKENCVCDTKDKLATNWPPYDKSCIQSLGGHDKPLLKVALEVPDSLCFVHFDMDCESASDEGRQHLSQNSCSQVGYESDDDENEFTL